jgi:hypothetical protein
MIYLFGKGRNVSVIYAEDTLSEQDKQGGIAVEALPPEQTPEGHTARLCLDENNKPYYEYEPIVEDTTEETPQE